MPSLIWGFHWELLLFLLFSANWNMIHKWSHQRRSETSYVIKKLQLLKLIQSKDHHKKHHSESFNHNYCIMTNFINPILRRIYFWEIIIKFLKLLKISTNNSLV
ncbi:fatty acid desaturase CarF family protein [Sediminicola arcticus]|uniref:Fatty acid desaturase CarF family protein n=1 Tax=Sediminicola arcticus TaxID=1574308 RepID=A0ABV2SVL8_9FLAO